MNQFQIFRLNVKFLAITKEEENYEEAVKAINSCFGGGKLTSRLQEILNDPTCNQLTKEVRFYIRLYIEIISSSVIYSSTNKHTFVFSYCELKYV